MNRIAALALALALSGCAARVSTASPKAVLVSNVSVFNLTTAQELAEAECQKHGRHAVFVNHYSARASYECKE